MPVPLPPPPAEVEAVVVYPPRLAPLAGEAAFSAVEITPEALNVSPRLDQALKQVPGVSLFRRTGSEAANPTTQGLSLRSIAPSGAGRTLVTLDGAPQNDPFGGWVIWTALPPEALDGATVVRGAGAGPYGAGALTGVVKLYERGARAGLAALDISAGEREGGRFAIAGGWRGALITASAETSAGFIPVRGPRRGAADTPTALDAWSVSTRLQRDLGGVNAAVRLSAFEEERGAGLVGANSTASGMSAVVTLARAPDEGAGGWRLQGWVRGSDLSNTSVAVAASRTGTTPANNQYATPAVGYGLNAAWQGERGPWSWELGGDLRITEGRVRELFRFMNGAFTRDRTAGGRTRVAGLYAEGVYRADDMLVTGGLRLDGWSSSHAIRRERDAATGAIVLDQPSPDASGTTPTARLGVRYRLGPVWARAAAYAGFRPPTLNELHRPFRVGNDITEANPGLTPETLVGAEVGFSGVRPDWSLTIFYNALHDPITNVTVGVGPATFPTAGFVPAGGVLRQRRNAGLIEAWGVEGDIDGEIGPWLDWRLAVSATRAEVDGGSAAPQLTGKRPAQTPEVTAVAGLAWGQEQGPAVNLDLRYEGARFEDDLNSRKLAPSLGVDLRLAWRFDVFREVYLTAENLFDAEIETGETADGAVSLGAPRTVRVGFSLRR